MSQDSPHPPIDKNNQPISNRITPETATLVSNSMLDASVQSFVPIDRQQHTIPAYNIPYFVSYPHLDMPADMAQPNYTASDAFIPETNTSVPPPQTIGYDAANGPMNYHISYSLPSHPYMQMAQAQASQPIYRMPPHYTYAVPAQPDYYGVDGNVREELVEGPEAPSTTGRLSSTSSTGPASNPNEYGIPQAGNKHKTQYNGNSSMVHVEHCHVNLSLYPGQGAIAPPYPQGVVAQSGPNNSLAPAGYAQHSAVPAMMHPTTSIMQVPHMQQCSPHNYPGNIIDQQQILTHGNMMRTHQQQQVVVAAAGHCNSNPIYRPDNQERGSMNNYRGGGAVNNRGRGTLNTRGGLARRATRRQDNDRTSTSSDRNSFSNDRYQYSSERNSFSEQELHSSDIHGQDIHVPHTIPQSPFMYHPSAYGPAAKKFEGPPLIMSQPLPPVYYTPPDLVNFNRERIPLVQHYMPPQHCMPHKEINQFMDSARVVDNAAPLHQSVNVPVNGVPAEAANDDNVFIPNGEVNSSYNHEELDPPPSRPSTGSLDNESGISVGSVEEIPPVYTELYAQLPPPADNSHNVMPNTTAAPIISFSCPLHAEHIVDTFGKLSLEREFLPVEDIRIVDNKVPSQKTLMPSANVLGSSSKVVPILEIKTENQLDLSFTMKFGDICPEEVYNDVNNVSETNICRIDNKDIKTNEKTENPMHSKSILTPLFDTTISQNDNSLTRITGDQSSGFSFVLDDCNNEMQISSSISFVNESVATKPASPIIKKSTPEVTIPIVHAKPIVFEDPIKDNGVSVESFIVPASFANNVTLPLPIDTTLPPPSTPTHSVPVAVKSVVQSRAVTSEKPPLPMPNKKPVQAFVPLPPQQASVVQSSGSGSAWGKNKNWTEQFKPDFSVDKPKKVAVVQPLQISGTGVHAQSAPVSAVPVMPLPTNRDHHSYDMERAKIGSFLIDYKPDYSSVTLQPRGLTNKNYWCYSNTVLQSLVSVPQFVNLYKKMDKLLGSLINSHSMPITNSIVSFIKEFAPMNTTNINLNSNTRGKKAGQNMVTLPEVIFGDSFEPSCINRMLLEKNGSQFMEGYQQDAEEMLTFLLNAGHDEFNECLKLASSDKSGMKKGAAQSVVLPNGAPDNDNSDWFTKGPKNKSCITRTTHFSHSPISKIFWGESRSLIKKGSSPATANLEPFITLPLDIQDEKITSVKAALDQFVSKADVAGYTCTDTQEELTVSNQRLLEQLPEVLILQLKRFVYSVDGGLQKVVKDITISIDLEITKDLVSPQSRKKLTADKSKYKLTSIISHDGKDANKGHYVSDVYHSGYNCWLHYDDACVKAIPASELQRCNAPRVPYLLFYRREDTFVGDFPTFAVGAPKKKKHDRRTASLEKIEAYERKAPVVDVASTAAQEQTVTSDKDKNTVLKTIPTEKTVDRKGSHERKESKERKLNNNTTKNRRQDKKALGKKTTGRN